MSGPETSQRTANRLADDQHSWGDSAVPLRRSVDHEERLRIVRSSPRAALPRGLAIAGLCTLALGLAAVVVWTHDDGPDPQLQTTRAREKHMPVQVSRAPGAVPVHRRATARRQSEMRAQRRAKRGKRKRWHASPSVARRTPSTDPSTPVPVTPTTTPSPPLSTPSSQEQPEFGL
jgi:hypothetical protein